MIIVLASALAIVGCAMPSGDKVSQATAMEFKEGVSTEAEIVAKFGKPTGVSFSGGIKTISYIRPQFNHSSSFNPFITDVTDIKASYELTPAGVLQKITYSEEKGRLKDYLR